MININSGNSDVQRTGILFRSQYDNVGNYQTLETLNLSGANSGLVRVRITTPVTLTGLKVTTAIRPGGTHRDYLTDADFDTPLNLMPYTSKIAAGTSLYQTAAAGVFEFLVDVRAIAEMTIQVKSASSGLFVVEIGS